jgi:hypothetical protein
VAATAAPSPGRGLPAFLLAYAAASLLHHVHNAEFLQDYPNLPASLTRGGVYAAWLGEAAVGLAGYALLRLGYRRTGLVVVALYALTGFFGLAHYSLAPVAAHSLAMNATIWLEVLAAGLLLIRIVAGNFRR